MEFKLAGYPAICFIPHVLVEYDKGKPFNLDLKLNPTSTVIFEDKEAKSKVDGEEESLTPAPAVEDI